MKRGKAVLIQVVLIAFATVRPADAAPSDFFGSYVGRVTEDCTTQGIFVHSSVHDSFAAFDRALDDRGLSTKAAQTSSGPFLSVIRFGSAPPIYLSRYTTDDGTSYHLAYLTRKLAGVLLAPPMKSPPITAQGITLGDSISKVYAVFGRSHAASRACESKSLAYAWVDPKGGDDSIGYDYNTAGRITAIGAGFGESGGALHPWELQAPAKALNLPAEPVPVALVNGSPHEIQQALILAHYTRSRKYRTPTRTFYESRGSPGGFVDSKYSSSGVLSNGTHLLIVPLDSGGMAGVFDTLLFVDRNAVPIYFIGYVPAADDGHLDVRITDGVLVVSSPVFLKGDAQCCNSMEDVIQYTVSANRLVQLSHTRTRVRR